MNENAATSDKRTKSKRVANEFARPKVPPSTERYHEIQVAAYYKTQQRGFQNSNPEKDWLDAEREIDAKYAQHTKLDASDSPRGSSGPGTHLLEDHGAAKPAIDRQKGVQPGSRRKL